MNSQAVLPFGKEEIRARSQYPHYMVMARHLLDTPEFMEFSKYEIMAAVIHDLLALKDASLEYERLYLDLVAKTSTLPKV